MTLASQSPVSDYATGYADGRHAAQERVPANENPFKRGTQCFHGWNDGHYDERSARCRGYRFYDEAHVPGASRGTAVHFVDDLRRTS